MTPGLSPLNSTASGDCMRLTHGLSVPSVLDAHAYSQNQLCHLQSVDCCNLYSPARSVQTHTHIPSLGNSLTANRDDLQHVQPAKQVLCNPLEGAQASDCRVHLQQPVNKALWVQQQVPQEPPRHTR